jgi:hypothetical protein
MLPTVPRDDFGCAGPLRAGPLPVPEVYPSRPSRFAMRRLAPLSIPQSHPRQLGSIRAQHLPLCLLTLFPSFLTILDFDTQDLVHLATHLFLLINSVQSCFDILIPLDQSVYSATRGFLSKRLWLQPKQELPIGNSIHLQERIFALFFFLPRTR